MDIFEIPTDKELFNYTFIITIDDIVYNFKILYNERIDRYTLTILDSENNEIVSGISILTNIALTDYFKYLDIPQGDIFALNTDNLNATSGMLGDTVKLYYKTN